jgi:hypothetical protein
MATCRDIIARAMQTAGIIPIGGQPTGKEAEHGQIVLQGIYDGWATGGMFGRLADVYVTDDYTAKEGERVFADGATVTLPETVDVEGGVRVPRDLAQISVNDGTWRHFVWTGAWTELTGLELGDVAPLAERDEYGFACLLASYLAPAFGTEVSGMTMRRGMTFQGSLSYKLGSTQDNTGSEYF